jgi:hypothetical protein
MKTSFTPSFVEPAPSEREPFAPVDESAGPEVEGAGNFQGFISQALNRPLAGMGAPGGMTSPDYYYATAANPDANGVQNPNLNAPSVKSPAKESDSDEDDELDSDDHHNDADATNAQSPVNNLAVLAQLGVLALMPPPPPVDAGKVRTVSANGQTGVTASTGVGDGSRLQAGGLAINLPAGVLSGQSLHHGSISPAPAAAAKDATLDAATGSPANGNAPGASEPVGAGDIKTQGIDIQKLMLEKISGSDPPPDNGMAAALNKEHMKFGAEKNEIAGDTEQKVPGLAEVDRGAGGLAQNAGTGSGHDFSDSRKEPGTLISGMEFSAQPGLMATPRNGPTSNFSTRIDPTAQIEQVTRLVNQEAVSVRQLGASSLAVSLKLDTHTELFLQLTNNDGQIQASLRCERGNIDGLSGHWGQLQDSLAKQNVQLLPLAEQGSTKNYGSNQFSGGSESRQFDQPPQSPQRQVREVSEPASQATIKPAPSRGGKNQKPGRPGWESWA